MARALPPRFDAMVAPARDYPQIWRLIVGLILAAIVYAVFVTLLVGAGWLTGGGDAVHYLMVAFTGRGAAAQTLILMVTFAGLTLGTMAAARALHGRGFATILGPDASRFARDFLRCFGIVFAVLALSVGIALTQIDLNPNLSPSVWILWLGPALALLIVQVSAEELMFRGYIQTQLAARFATPLVWLVLPSVLFGLAHYNPAGMGGNVWVIVLAATLYGLIAGDLTAQTGNLGAAIGFHLANNVFAVLIVAMDGTITGLSLYLTPFTADQVEVTRPLLIQDGLIMLLAWGLCRWAVRR